MDVTGCFLTAKSVATPLEEEDNKIVWEFFECNSDPCHQCQKGSLLNKEEYREAYDNLTDLGYSSLVSKVTYRSDNGTIIGEHTFTDSLHGFVKLVIYVTVN